MYVYCTFSIFMRVLDPYPFFITSAHNQLFNYLVVKNLSLYLIHNEYSNNPQYQES